MPDPARHKLLEVHSLGKSFPGVQALQKVSLSLDVGEVLSVIGENGAGKSTLMKILAGVQSPDEGEIWIDGSQVEFANVRAAQNLGIALIHQELNLASNLSVGANIFLGREPLRAGLIDNQCIKAKAEELLERVGLRICPDTIVEELSIGRQQLVEIAKALSINARVLIMDEPTSSLSQEETENLFEVVKDLRRRGISIIYISHRLGEVKELSDRVIVLRDGENAGELHREIITHDNMVKLMVGRDLSQFYAHQPHPPLNPILEVADLCTPTHPTHPLNFTIRSGEVVGLAGLVGSGRTELMQTLFGVTPAIEGTIRVAGQTVKPAHPWEAIATGIALVPEDRKQQGLVPPMSVRENMSLPSLWRDQVKGFLNFTKEDEITTDMIEHMRVKTPSHSQVVQYLSGGNQQKVVLGKWLAMHPHVLLLDEPTRGIDIGAKQEIYGLMEELARQGVGILFASSEMEEVLGMSDRIMVMHEGQISGELLRDEISEEAIMQLATGHRLAA
mgnify:CR=1 FL=1|tara:strand:+ start:2184 stop:3695 length:1512 start_codon:yes stop_codon:yes gene_type:complete